MLSELLNVSRGAEAGACAPLHGDKLPPQSGQTPHSPFSGPCWVGAFSFSLPKVGGCGSRVTLALRSSPTPTRPLGWLAWDCGVCLQPGPHKVLC